MRLACVIGVRPHLIKIAPLIAPLRAAGIAPMRVHTGQHPDPGTDKAGPGRWASLHARAHVQGTDRASRLEAMTDFLGQVFMREQPGAVLVIGDTDTTLAGARAALAASLPLIHVESGCPTGPDDQPESVNRREIEALATLACTPHAAIPLNDGPGERIFTGDLLYDAFLEDAPAQRHEGESIVCTLHRAELFEEPDRLAHALEALASLAQPVRLPVHPARRGAIERALPPGGRITLAPPAPRAQFLEWLAGAGLVITDSGGVVREGLFSGRKTVHAGAFTAWEGAAGPHCPAVWAIGDEPLGEAISRVRRPEPGRVHAAFGAGQASVRIAAAIAARYSVS